MNSFHIFPCNRPWRSHILAGVLKFYFISVCSRWSWVCALVGELGKDPSYGRWDRKLVTFSSKGNGMRKC